MPRKKDPEPSLPFPVAADYENALAGTIISNKAIAAMVRPFGCDLFYQSKVRAVVEAAFAVMDSRGELNIVSVAEKLRQSGALEKVGGLSFLADLDSAASIFRVSNGMVPAMVDTLLRYRARRQLMRELDRHLKMVSTGSDLESVVYSLKSTIASIESSFDARSDRPMSIEELERAAGGLDRLIEDEGGRIAVTCPWSSLTQFAGAFRTGRVTVIAGKPGAGKTTMMLQLCIQAAMEGSSCLFCSLEMPIRSVIVNCLSMVSSVPVRDVNRMALSRDEYESISRSWRMIRSCNLRISPANHDIYAIRSMCEQLKAAHGLDAVFIDYFQLIHSGRNRWQNRNEELSDISNQILSMAMDLDIAVFVGSQLSRHHQKQEREPDLLDLKDCGTIGEASAMVIILHPLKKSSGPNTKVRVVKNRFGPIGDAMLDLNRTTVRFEDPNSRPRAAVLVPVEPMEDEGTDE